VKTIREFPLHFGPRNVIDMPQGAEILGCGWRCDNPLLWVLIDTYVISTPRLVVLMPTNAQCDFANETPVFIGRLEVPGTGHVFHLFDLGEKPITPFSEGTPE
jgi:hypothetical protein